ncbi:hypothetical protein [Streptomyces sp. B1I3]|uniref:hypothetical protein n=1 Tax=Streptomyces sp. B1I3 TaxID=3042264 RepID=UPI00278B0FF5|nr:hypothetical protein [Streptomyces sp. B1I3]MDQ0796464.1 hypothetical protein [Streptomyces sp. B1I3]
MSQEPDVHEREAVELKFRPTSQDCTGALRARARVSAESRRHRLLGCLLLAAEAALAGAELGLDVDFPVILYALGCVVGPLMFLTPWLTGRQMWGYVKRQGEFRVRVDEDGLTVAMDHSSGTVTWAAQPRYVETGELFVLLSDDRNATGITVLAKRGAAGPADVDRLRAMFDRHLTRV